MKKITAATLVGMVLSATVLILDSKSQALVAKGILRSLDRTDGLCVLVNVTDFDLVIGIATDSNYVINAVYDNANAVERMRQKIDRHNLYGRVSVGQILPGNGALSLRRARRSSCASVYWWPGCKSVGSAKSVR